jgi:hypothetical protein
MLQPSKEELESEYYRGFQDLPDSADDTIDRLEAELADVAVLRPVDGIQDPPINEDATHPIPSSSQARTPFASPSDPIPSSSQARTPLAASSTHRTVGFEEFGGGQGFSPSFDVPPPREKSEEDLLSRVNAIEEAIKGMARDIAVLVGGQKKEEKEKAETETEKAEREKVEKEQAEKEQKKRMSERKRMRPPRLLSPNCIVHWKKRKLAKRVKPEEVVKKLKKQKVV